MINRYSVTQQIMTANDLLTGTVVFLNKHLEWTAHLYEAVITNDQVTIDDLERVAQRDENANSVVNPYPIEVSIQNDKPLPLRYREQLRVYGPSVHRDFAKPLQKGVDGI